MNMSLNVDKLTVIRDIMVEADKIITERSDKLWNSFSNEDQLDLFLAVVRRIYKGEYELQGSYRDVLYEVFGFGPEAYVPAQMAGYLDIHNACVLDREKSKK